MIFIIKIYRGNVGSFDVKLKKGVKFDTNNSIDIRATGSAIFYTVNGEIIKVDPDLFFTVSKRD